MLFLKKNIIRLGFSILITLIGICAGYFSDCEKSYEFNRCFFSTSEDSEIVGGSINYDSYEDFKSVIKNWQDNFEIPLLRNCKSILDINDSVSFIETEPYESDSKYNTFKIYSQTGSSWRTLSDNRIFISTQMYYSRFGNRDYDQAIGQSINIAGINYIIGGVFFVNYNESAKKLISDYLYQEIGECVFVGKDFFKNVTPSRTLVTFETNNKSAGEVYLNIVNFFSSNGLQYSLFNNSDVGKNINSKIDSLNSFYSSSYKIVLAIVLNACFVILCIVAFSLLLKEKAKTPLLLVFSALLPSFLILALKNVRFSSGIYLVNKTSVIYVIVFILLFSIGPIYHLVVDENKRIITSDNVCYEEINI